MVVNEQDPVRNRELFGDFLFNPSCLARLQHSIGPPRVSLSISLAVSLSPLVLCSTVRAGGASHISTSSRGSRQDRRGQEAGEGEGGRSSKILMGQREDLRGLLHGGKRLAGV